MGDEQLETMEQMEVSMDRLEAEQAQTAAAIARIEAQVLVLQEQRDLATKSALLFKTAAEKLWALLDAIDTEDDRRNSDFEGNLVYRERVREVQKKRHEIATSEDGQTLVCG